MSFNNTVDAIRRLLQEERQTHTTLAPHERPPLTTCESRRQRINDLLAYLPRQAEQEIASLTQAIAFLPHIPSTQEMHWAECVLALANLAIVEVETTDLTTSASILRVTLLDGKGQLIDDLVVHPPQAPSQTALDLTGITAKEVTAAPPLEEVWARLQSLFAGRYLLSFHLEVVRDRLLDEARRMHRAPLPFLGESLRPHCGAYFGEVGYGFTSLCSHIGVPLPPSPTCTSLHRAQRQVQIVQLMAQGRFVWQEPNVHTSQQDAEGGTHEQ